MSNKGYIYIRDNEWYVSSNVYKVGMTTSIKDRNNTYITGELHRGFYVKIYEFNINEEELRKIDKLLKEEFEKENLNIYYDGGKEFYKRDIINKIENIFIEKIKKEFIIKTEEELERINRNNDIIKKNKEKLRNYQEEAINYLTNELKINNRCYLYLATGAGKSLISMNVISNIQPLNVIIFSPRITIKNQNINPKYLEILENYSIENKNNKNNNYIIYSYCYQSYKNVYKMIKNNNLNNILIWFDEAHWALDNWVNKDINNEIKHFFINDNKIIKYRLFTTASPDKNLIINNKKIYGELYQPIKFKELQEKSYLCKIQVEIFDKEIEKEKIKYNSLIFNTFNKPNQERKMGFSFHNTCNSAYTSYLYHLKDFNEGLIDIKPYLLINDDFIKKEKELFKDNNYDNYDNLNEDLKIIKRIKKEIGEIDYYNEIKNFEKEIDKNQKVLGYVVAKYSIGYDNNNIDIIYFTDYKLSYKDIIQSIGRGTRTNENNKDKYLRVILPTNSNDEIGVRYKNIEKVLKYLLLEIELDYDKIKTYKFKKELDNSLLSLSLPSPSFISYYFEEDLDDKSPINTMKLMIMAKANEWTIPKILTQLKYNNIHTIKDYNSYSYKNRNLNLPDINELLENQNFNFRDTYNSQKECPYYYDKYDCIKVINKNEDYFIMNDIIDDLDKLNYLISIDDKIPKMNLWLFYGGNKSDFF